MKNLNFLFSGKCFRFIQITSVLVMFYIPALKAQDTIVKRNDEKIIVKILEVNPTDIKYKRFDYQAGPTFTVLKWDLKYIVYGNGVKESFEGYISPANVPVKNDFLIQPTGNYYYFKNQKISEQNMLDIVWKQQDIKTNQVVTKTEKMKFTKNCFLVGGIALGAGGILTFAGVFSALNSRTNISTVGGGRSSRTAQRAARSERQRLGGYMILGGLSCEILSVTFNIKEKKYANIVVDLYNKAIP